MDCAAVQLQVEWNHLFLFHHNFLSVFLSLFIANLLKNLRTCYKAVSRSTIGSATLYFLQLLENCVSTTAACVSLQPVPWQLLLWVLLLIGFA